MHLSVTTAQNGVGSSVPPSSCVIPGNVASWLVARFAIVTKILQIILNPCVVWKVRYCGKKSWETTFCPTKMCKKNYINIFFWKNIACLPPKRIRPLIKPLFKNIRPLIKPLLKNSFSHISKALGHERVQFTLVGLFSSFTIAANFSRADPGAKRRKKSLLQKQLRSSKSKPFPEESDRLLNPYIPLLKNSFSTNFQGTGPWEGPVHFSRFVLKVNNCSKLFQSWSWVHLPLPLPLPLPLALCSSSSSSSSSCFSSSSSSSSSSSLSLSFSFSFSLSLSFFLSLSLYTLNRKLRWKRQRSQHVESHSLQGTTNTTSSSAKKKFYIIRFEL